LEGPYEAAKVAGFKIIQSTFDELEGVLMELPKGDDDKLDIKRVTITKPGQSQTIQFHSKAEGATYNVTFKHTTAP
jgi:hypothetical protein